MVLARPGPKIINASLCGSHYGPNPANMLQTQQSGCFQSPRFLPTVLLLLQLIREQSKVFPVHFSSPQSLVPPALIPDYRAAIGKPFASTRVFALGLCKIMGPFLQRRGKFEFSAALKSKFTMDNQ